MKGSRSRSVFVARLVDTTHHGDPPHVLDDMRRAILSGDEPPGTRIPVESVAEFFGVSQIPVREALKVLIGEHLVDHVPHVGYRVAKLTFAEFSELYQIREALELAALFSAVPHARPADDDVAQAAHAGFSAAIDGDDEREYHQQSRRFHMALIAPARMPRLISMYESAWNMTEPTRPMARVSAAKRAVFCHDHSRLLQAFLGRDVGRIVDLTQEHYVHLRASIAEFADDPDLFRVEP